jgi:D-alanine-D-alanine ligase
MPAKSLRILVLMHDYLVPPADRKDVDPETADWRTEYDVCTALKRLKHDIHPLGVKQDLGVINEAITEFKPQIAFNLLEAFDEVATFDQNVVSHLELLRMPYTGCNPRGLLLSRDKALSKKLLAYHRIPMPEFAVYRRGRAIKRPAKLRFPLIVKSLTQEASIGISQASVVETDEKLRERVEFIHESVGTDAIVERFIEGRELYVGVLGNLPLRVLPVWEMFFKKLPDEVRRIATERVKWSTKYQKKHGIETGPAEDLPEGAAARIERLAKRVYRALDMTGYGRIDLRLDAEGHIYVLEANPNPQIAKSEDFAQSALKAGIKYEALLQRIVNLGLRWNPSHGG